jgi:hypothetical protein
MEVGVVDCHQLEDTSLTRKVMQALNSSVVEV